MYSNLQPVDKNKHAELKFNPVSGFSFASQVLSAPLVATELAAASKDYPVVFSSRDESDPLSNKTMPLAIFSFVSGENPFINSQGEWSAQYIPAYIRSYPFATAAVGETDQYALMVDLDSVHFKSDEGKLLFDDKGKPSAVLEQSQKFLEKHRRAVLSTLKLMEQLEKAEVLVPYQFTIGNKEHPRNIRGFQVIDTKKLAALDDATLAAWVRNGVMSLIFSHLASMSNVKKIVNLQSDLLA